MMIGPNAVHEAVGVTALTDPPVILDVSGLRIDFASATGYLNVVDDVSFQVAKAKLSPSSARAGRERRCLPCLSWGSCRPFDVASGPHRCSSAGAISCR